MNNEVLSFRGGKYTSLIPFLLMVAGLLGCSAMGLAAMEAFWVVACVCIMLGMVLASDSAKYFDAIIHGAASPLYITPIFCWIFAGMFASILKASGLGNGLVWMGLTFNIGKGFFRGYYLSCGSDLFHIQWFRQFSYCDNWCAFISGRCGTGGQSPCDGRSHCQRRCLWGQSCPGIRLHHCGCCHYGSGYSRSCKNTSAIYFGGRGDILLPDYGSWFYPGQRCFHIRRTVCPYHRPGGP